MLNNLEGVVLKDMSSPCMPGTRDGSWVKLKPDYIDEMGKVLSIEMSASAARRRLRVDDTFLFSM